jgi:hypothetical protein
MQMQGLFSFLEGKKVAQRICGQTNVPDINKKHCNQKRSIYVAIYPLV